MNLSNEAKEFWRRNQVVILHLPFLVLALFACYVVSRALDPRIGVEGFGDLFGYGLNAIRIALVVYIAWWFKRWALFDLHSKTELELFEAQKNGDYNARRIIIRDRIEWAFLLTWLGWMFSL